ncbi:MAG: hypothetical protein LBF63_08650 [Treponema sp.]|jgi:hypothetical protein|nr:hypothetical protein [Treponema sp.]
MKIEPIITGAGIIKKGKYSILFNSMEQEWNTLIIYGTIDPGIFDNKDTPNTKNLKFILYFNDVIFYNCYEFDFYPNFGKLKSSFDIINYSNLTKKITVTDKSIYNHFVLVTSDYIYEIISANYILELNSKEDSLEKYYNENNWKKFSELCKGYHSNNTEKLIEKLNMDIELSKVIDKAVGKNAVDWINRKIPALNNITPIECLRNRKLKNRLKVMLMRM